MRFMIIHKTNAHWESGATPSLELIKRVGALLGELGRAGVLLGGEGLRATSLGVRATFRRGKRTTVPGPLNGTNKVPGSWIVVRTESIDAAVDSASRFAEVLGDVEVDIRPVTEGHDINMAPKPQHIATRRYMAVFKTSERAQLSDDQVSAWDRLKDEMAGTGVLLAAERFALTARSKRLQVSPGAKPRVLDGPFTESKELIGGYVMVRGTLDEAVAWASKYIDIVDTEEVDVLQLEGNG